MPTAAATPIERAHCRIEPASVYRRPRLATSAGRVAASASSMKSPHQRLSQIGGVRMDFGGPNDSRTSNKRDEIRAASIPQGSTPLTME